MLYHPNAKNKPRRGIREDSVVRSCALACWGFRLQELFFGLALGLWGIWALFLEREKEVSRIEKKNIRR